MDAPGMGLLCPVMFTLNGIDLEDNEFSGRAHSVSEVRPLWAN